MVIIPISSTLINNEETNSVNARDLHRTLGVKKKFADWIKAQISSLYLEENRDYIVIPLKGNNPSGGRPLSEYIITTDTAKGIAMATRTQKGNEVRKYFIEVEKKYKAQMYGENLSQEITPEFIDTLAYREIEKHTANIQKLTDALTYENNRKHHWEGLLQKQPQNSTLSEKLTFLNKVENMLRNEELSQTEILSRLGINPADAKRLWIKENIGVRWSCEQHGGHHIYSLLNKGA